ncbi:MAG TPA: protein phosphatase 2C domain-containing protein [Verrucomicrobiae bacterium]|nr:protein phosphatase 2C domain-containing protein [Verrucomicrobiae bacterium]
MPERFPSSKPPEKPETERPTIPVPRNPFELQEQVPLISAFNIPDPTKLDKPQGEDAYSEDMDVDKNGVTLSVEDGVGGYPGSEYAARAVAELAKDYQAQFEEINERRHHNQLPNPEDVSEEQRLLDRFLQDASLEVAAQRLQHAGGEHMSTTAVLARLVRVDGHWEVVGVSVGDSRAYLQHPDGRLEALTLDAHPIMLMMRDVFGRDTALRVQEILDNLESFQQFENFAKFSREDKWPEHMPVNREDIDMVFQLVGPQMVKEYFEGAEPTPEDPGGRGFFHRSLVNAMVGSHPLPDHFRATVPPGGRLMLVSDGVESLTRRELSAILAEDEQALLDRTLKQYAWQGLTPAERVARAASARNSGFAWSRRSKGPDDITVVVAEIPAR